MAPQASTQVIEAESQRWLEGQSLSLWQAQPRQTGMHSPLAT